MVENVLLFGIYDANPHDMRKLVYKGLKSCSCLEFTEFMTAMQNVDKLSPKKTAFETNNILKKAEKEYTDLLGRKESGQQSR